MNSWYVFSIVALVLLGTQRFLYKVAAQRGCRSALTTAVFMGTVTLLSTASYFASGAFTQDYPTLITLALVNSASFAVSTIANIEALKHLPAGIIFPLTRLSLVLVIFASVFYFGEPLDPLQWLGILFCFAVVTLLGQEARGEVSSPQKHHQGFYFVLTCILCGAIASISSKLAAISTSKSAFMALSYLFGTGFSVLTHKKLEKEPSIDRKKEAILIGMLMGGLNFLGFYAFLSALTTGPLSSVALITSMHFVIAIVLSVWLYHERITWRRGLAIGLTLLAVVFLKS